MTSFTPLISSSPFDNIATLKHYLHKGTAAVMVGAGFSRNADPTMPLWKDLGQKLVQALGKDGVCAFEDILELAQAYEDRMLTRAATINFIKDNIQDTASPSKLHTELLSLPWSDVFTTNYDRFLEKAAPNSKRFKLVASKGDFALSKERGVCRIIKLHGTLPSLEHCVFTKNDYERYPKDYDVFVTAVKNSMTENAFVLIGFSGTDPNFVNWIQWVRQELGAHSPPVFMIHLTQLSENEQKFLGQYKVVPINISTLFTPETTKDSFESENLTYSPALPLPTKYEAALSSFFEYLQNGYEEEASSARAVHKPPHVTWKYPRLNIRPVYPKKISLDAVLQGFSKMRQGRLSYPGWICLDPPNISHLWYMVGDLNDISQAVAAASSNELQLSQKIQILYELGWVIDKSHLPDFNSTGQTIEKILLESFSAITSPETFKEECRLLASPFISNSGEIVAMWLEMACLVLRWRRGLTTPAEFDEWQRKIKIINVYTSIPRISDELSYQTILHHLERFERQQAYTALAGWHVNEPMSLASLRSAMLWAEFGDIDRSFSLLKTLQATIKKTIDGGDNSPKVRSLGQWCEYYIKIVLNSVEYTKLLGEKNSALSEEEAAKSIAFMFGEHDETFPSPKSILEDLEHSISLAAEKLEKEPLKAEFDMERRGDSIHFHSGFRPGISEALKYINVTEKMAAVPIVGRSGFSFHHLILCIKILGITNESLDDLAWNLCLHLGSKEVLDDKKLIFSRLAIAQTPISLADAIAQQLISNLESLAANKWDTNAFSPYNLHFVFELLSRLAPRISQKTLEKLFSASIACYSCYQLSQDFEILSDYNTLLRRVIQATPQSYLKKQVLTTLSLPVLRGVTITEDIRPDHYWGWQDPVAFLPNLLPGVRAEKKWSVLAKKLWKKAQQNKAVLLAIDAKTQNVPLEKKEDTPFSAKMLPYVITPYYWRLLWMIENKVIDGVTLDQLGKDVWENVPEGKLPQFGDLLPYAALRWPSPRTTTDIGARYKKKLLAHGATDFLSLLYHIQIPRSLRKRFSFSLAEKEQLFDICTRAKLPGKNSIPIPWTTQAERIPFGANCWILPYILGDDLSRIDPQGAKVLPWLTKLLKAGEVFGKPSLRVSVLRLLYDAEHAGIAARQIKENLYNENVDIVMDAGCALYIWRSAIARHAPLPLPLSDADTEAFWLTPHGQILGISNVLCERLSGYPELPFSHNAIMFIRYGLEKHFATLQYHPPKRKEFGESGALKSTWQRRQFQLTLPEYRNAMGEFILALCKHTPDVRLFPEVKRWLETMKNDPLSDIRNLYMDIEKLP